MATETTCVFCSRSFTRSDALKRHWTTCKVRIDSGLDVPVPETKTRGRKARACDRCSRLKRACDSKVPCAPCKSEKENCTYRRLQHKLAIRSEKQGHAALSAGVDRTSGLVAYQSTAPDAMFYMDDNCNVTWAPIGEHALATSTIHRPTKIDFALLARFPFLENHTRATGFITSFQCGTTQERISLIEDLASFDRPSHSPIDSVQAFQRPPHWIQATWNALTAYDSHEIRDLEVGALMTKTHEIVSEIRKNTLMRPHESSTRLTWSISLEASCYEFFNPIALRKYLALFWSCWYPNWPVIHRPTFDTRHKSPILVAVLAIIGACLSPDPRDQVNAKTWFDSVEEIVFGDNVFFQDDTSAAWRNLDQKPLRTKHLEILQAAYGVCLYQTWEGEKQSRRRVLRNRFDHLIYLTRDIGIAEASLQSVVTAIPQAFDWEEYVLRESLIRLNCYICNIDASYALFFRVMPRMNFSELVMELPSPESCFQARSREECFVELKNWRTRCGSNTSQFTIRTAVETLSDPRRMENSNAQQRFPQLSVLGMFTIVHVLYAMVHCMQSIGIQSPDAIMSSPVAIALQQWGRLWPSWSRDAEIVELALKGRQSSTAWQSIGFIKHAPEYWLLTQLFLNQLAKRSVGASTGGLDNIERSDASMDKARALITELSHTAPTLS